MADAQHFRWVAPPNWPPLPQGWQPPPGWQPDPTWPDPPPGWQFWLPVQSSGPTSLPKAPPAAPAPAGWPSAPSPQRSHAGAWATGIAVLVVGLIGAGVIGSHASDHLNTTGSATRSPRCPLTRRCR